MSNGAAQFFLSATATGRHPFALGFAFKQGDIPAGRSPLVDIVTSQVTVMTTWPDGSAKWAVVAGHADLTAGSALSATLSHAASGRGGAVLTTAQLRATGVVASFDCGGYGTVNWSGADWDSPARTWVSGPQMSSWVYRKPVGSDAHLVAWMEVRLFSSGAVEVLPWIENGYLRVAGPSVRVTSFGFSLGGTERFRAAIELPNHCRTPLVSGTTLSYWLGSDPDVVATHDTAYLQASELVPTYFGATAASAAVVTALPSSYVPLQQGSYASTMGTAGYHGSIGLLPEWDVLYLTTGGSSRTWRALQYNAYSAGRFGIHFRDETSNRPLRFSVYPNLCMGGGSGVSSTGSSSIGSYTPTATGLSPAAFASSHHPSMGYMAALLTGRMYHLETLQFVATANFLKNPDEHRGFTAGVLKSNVGANTTRGAAWALRTLVQAAVLSPDADELQAEFVASVDSNISYYHGRYVAQANNPNGWVTPYSDYSGVGDGIYFGASWMEDFMTAAFGYLQAVGLPLSAASATRLTDFFAWKSRSIVGRFGGTGSDEFLYRDAASYTLAYAPSDSPNFNTGTGPWFANWGAAYLASYPTSPGPREVGGLRGGNFPEATSYWGNLMPALAYAVRFDAPGAAAAYARLTGASNWASLRDGFDASPVWGVQPRS